MSAGDGAVRTTCPYCGVGCGLTVQASDRGGDGAANSAGEITADIAGDPAHPANMGRTCSKGAALGETLGLGGRLLTPRIGGQEAGWDDALDLIAARFSETIAEYGPDSVAFYVSGQLLTEDYYVANKLMKGFIGSANIDTNSRLCMASSVVGHKRAFGSDTVPGCYEDLERADLIVLTGSNAAWCHPILHRRMTTGGAKMVVIDPRRTATCDGADLHLPLRPGTDAVLFNGLLVALETAGALDRRFIANHTEGFDDALDAARDSAPDIAAVSAATGLDQADIATFYDWFIATGKTVTLYSQGINQSSSGTDKVNAILNCHLATGRIGRAGAGPFSLTGQPNAMGGREVGGLANQLAAHMEIGNPAHRALVQDFWQAPRIAEAEGLKAVDMFDAIGDRRIKAVWIMSTNPLVSLPNADAARAALDACPFVVVSDCIAETDTGAAADVLLPAAAWGEKDGTVTNSERRISRQRAFLSAPGAAKPDWWAMAEVAKRMGFADAFDYGGPAAIFREHAALSGYRNAGTRDFDISGLAGIDDATYDALSPIQWPVTEHAPHGTARMFADGRFFTPNRRARFLPIAPRRPVSAATSEYPLILNTGRLRDHWHSMTRTGLSARLSAHTVEPTLDMHPGDAARNGLADGALAEVTSAHGRMVARVRLTTDQAAGGVFAAMHWSAQFAPAGRVNPLVAPVCDPYSGQPESKHTPVRVAPYEPGWHAFVLSRAPVSAAGATYWARAKGDGMYRYECAGTDHPGDWDRWAADLMGDVAEGAAGGAAEGAAEGAEWIVYRDATAGTHRYACVVDGRLAGCVFIARGPALPARSWLAGLFARDRLDGADRISLLAGQPASAADDAGETICACFGVGLNRIKSAIADQALTTVEEIGAALKAGTNCGSCRPELAGLLRQQERSAA